MIPLLKAPHICVDADPDTRSRSFPSRGDSWAMLFNDGVQERGPNIYSLTAIVPEP